MVQWEVEIDERAAKEVRRLPTALKARYLHISELLQSEGPDHVGMPHVKHIEGKLWEMRMKAKGSIARAIYFTVEGKRIIVLSAFVKKTQKTPKKEIRKARKRMEEWV